MNTHPIWQAFLRASQSRKGLRYLSVCSGIEAATTAWHPLGWTPVAFSEIEKFPSAVLAHHWPHVPNLGDMTKWREWGDDLLASCDLIVGGTPCQAFSVAGLRKSLDDDRGNLTLTYAHLIDHIDKLRRERGLPPVIVVWENVPGVLSTKDNAFGCLLGMLAGEDEALVPPGKRWANAGVVIGPERQIGYRVLDAQHFGVAQRRRRVFLVASARNGFCPAEVLFEPESVRRDSPPSREAGEGLAPSVAGCLGGSSQSGGFRTTDLDNNGAMIPEVAPTLDAQMDRKWGSNQWVNNGFAVVEPACMSSGQANAEIRTDGGAPSLTCLHEAPIVAHTLKGEGFDASEDGTGRGTPLVPVAFSCKDHGADAGDLAPTLRSMGHDGSHANGGGQVAVAFKPKYFTGVTGKMEGAPTTGAHPPLTTAGGDTAPCVAFTTEQTPKFNHDQALTLTKQSPTGGGQPQCVSASSAVRRLTPTECERLQGFPDGHTLIPWRGKPAEQCPDGPRYKALGNSMAVPCMKFIGERIAKHIE